MNWWVANYWESDRIFLVSWLVWVIVSIVLHELAHGWTAIRLGDRTPIETGHMTPNPIVHMGPMALIFLLMLGFTWGSMPINPSRIRGRHGDAIVAAAGPAMNLALAIVCMILGAVWIALAGGHWLASVNLAGQPIFENLSTFFLAGVMINVILLLLNLIPVMPLDGSRIVASFHRGYEQFFQTEAGTFVTIGGLILLFIYGVDYLFAAGSFVAMAGIDTLTSLFVGGA